MEGIGPGPEDPSDEFWATKAYAWIVENAPKSNRVRIAGIVVSSLLLIGIVVAMVALPSQIGPDDNRLALFSLIGLFIVCFASANFLLFPIPGFSLVALGLVLQQGSVYNPVAVGLVAAAGWVLGDAVIYAAGAVGGVAIEKHVTVPERFQERFDRVVSAVERWMKRFGSLLLTVVTAIPNPVVGVALLAAGRSRMAFQQFLVFVSFGRAGRGLVVAFVGFAFVTRAV